MRWEQGRTVIEQMLSAGDLQRVPASREHADRLLEQARRHVSSTQNAAVADPEGAYALLYDAARKALTAILENQGLRPTSRGGHLAVCRPAVGTGQPVTVSNSSQEAISARCRSSAGLASGGAPGSQWIPWTRNVFAARSALRSTRATRASPNRNGSA